MDTKKRLYFSKDGYSQQDRYIEGDIKIKTG